MKTIEILDNTKRAIAERNPRYDVMFRGEFWCELYYNLRGWVGTLPAPYDGNESGVISLTIGEKGIKAYRKEAARLNREWAAISAGGVK